MAEHADGSIIVDTEIDTKGFAAGSSELQRAIKSLNNKIQALGPTFQKALSGNASALSNFEAKAATLENTISELEAQLKSLGEARVPTEDYQWLTTEIEKAKNQLMLLDEKQIKMEAMGVKKSSQTWKSLQYDIEEAKAKIADYEAEQEQMRNAGTAFQMGSSTAEYSQLESALASAKSKLAEMQAQADGASGSTSRLAKVGYAVKAAFSKIGNVGKKAFKGCAKAIGTAVSKIKNLKKSSGGATGAISKLGKKITGLGSTLKRMALRKIMSAILSAVKEGFNNLAQYSTQTNKDLSALKSGLTRLKNSFASAFAPILTVVTPALTKLIDYLSTAITYVGKLFAALSGAKTFTKATAVQEDYAASLNGTSQAAKDAQRQLTGFDDLNVLSDSSSNSESGETSPSEMFEEVPIESSITDFVSRLKEAFVSGDYSGIGEAIGNGINTAIQKANDFIKWDNVGGTITNFISSVAEGFNSLIHTVNWQQIGDTFAQGFNTAINTLFLALTEFDWPGLAAGLVNNLNGFVSGVDWANLGTKLSTGMKTLLATLRSAITTFDWSALGKGIADWINNIDWVGIISDLAAGVSDLLKGALDLLIGFAKSLWESLKSAFESTKNYFATYIDEAGGNVIQGLLNGIWNGIKNIGTWIKEHIFEPFINGFKNAFGIHSPSTVMSEMGGYLIEGLLQGIKNLWSSITGFFSNALSSLKQTISNAWAEIKQGAQTAWQGISSTVSNAWSGIKTDVSTACTAVKTTASNAWNSVKSATSTAWNAVKSGVSTAVNGAKTAASTAWNSIKSTASSVCSSIKSTVSSAWSNVKSSVSNAVNNVKSSASSAWNSVKSTVSSVNNSIKSTVSSAWTSMKSTVSTKLSDIKSSATSTFTSLKNSATTWGEDVCQNMADGISKAKSTIESAVKGVAEKIKGFLGFSEPEDGPLSNFHTYMPDMIDLMAYGIKQNQGKAIGAVSDMASAISGEIQNGDYAMGDIQIGNGATAALGDFSDKITNSFATLIDRLQAIANGVTFATPAIATGNVVPYSIAASNNADSTGISNAIEASNDELASVIIQTVSNAAASIVSAIQQNTSGNNGMDMSSATTQIINEINRRTRMLGKSPLTR